MVLTRFQNKQNQMLHIRLIKRNSSIASNLIPISNSKSPRKKVQRKSKSNNINEDILRSNEARNSFSPASNDLFGGRAPSISDENNSNHDNEPNLNAVNDFIDLNSINPIAHNNHNNKLQMNLLRQYPEIYTDSTLLLDIDAEHYGIFTGISPSLLFIPDKYIKKTRAIWSKYMQKVIDDGSDKNWKKLILLPLIIFDYDNHETLLVRKRNYKTKLDKLLNDDWSTFTLGSLSKKTIKSSPISLNEIHASATRLAEVGEIGKAYKKLLSDRNRVIPTQDVLQKLQSKFPIPGNTDLTNDQIASIYSYNPDLDDDTEPIVVSIAEVETIILKAKKKVAHGIDHMRYEQIKQLWNPYHNDPTDGVFRNLFTSVINKIVQGQVPIGIVPIFKDIELLALPKGEEDIRPIGLQLILKKIACAICLKRTTAFNNEHFNSLQYCMSPLGTESVSLFARAALESNPEMDLWAKDGENGFGRLSRISGLFQTKKHFRGMLPILRMIYGTSSKAWFMGLQDGIEGIDSSEGCQQGDVLSMWFYAMAIHPFLQKIRNVLGNDGFTKWYADDGNTIAHFDKMTEVIRIVKEEGPKVGYYIKFSKGSYLLGKCATNDEAIRRRNILVELGLNEETIHMHPDNDPQNAIKYGCNILGSYVGSSTYIQSCLEEKLGKLAIEAEAIKNYPNKQVQHLILRLCFSQKINHLQRSIPPEYMTDFVANFDAMKRDIFENILGTSISDNKWLQCCLSTNDSGLGYQNVKNMVYPAYISSLVQCSSTLEELSPTIFSSDIPMIKSFNASLTANAELSASNPLTYDDVNLTLIEASKKKVTLQSMLFGLQRENVITNFQNSIRDTKHLAWIISLSSPNSKASRWLDVTPKYQEFKFKDEEFQTLLCYRLMLPQPVFVPESKCYCKPNPKLDSYGHHLSAGCAKDGTLHKTHDALKLVIKDICNYAGLVTRLEEPRCFQESNPDSNRRPDVSLFNYPFKDPLLQGRKLIIDVAATHPTPILGNKTLSRNEALQSCRAANRYFQVKIHSYLTLCNANNLEFLPIIFENTGKMHPKTESFLDEVISFMNVDVRGRSALQFYWYAKLSCSLQKSLANAILSKSRIINGNLTRINSSRDIDCFIVDYNNIDYLNNPISSITHNHLTVNSPTPYTQPTAPSPDHSRPPPSHYRPIPADSAILPADSAILPADTVNTPVYLLTHSPNPRPLSHPFPAPSPIS